MEASSEILGKCDLRCGRLTYWNYNDSEKDRSGMSELKVIRFKIFWGCLLKEKVKVKVKCTVVQALRSCRGCTTHRGSRGIAVL